MEGQSCVSVSRDFFLDVFVLTIKQTKTYFSIRVYALCQGHKRH